MHEIIAICGGILFILLTPGLLLRIPQKESLLISSIVHSIIFAILFYLISRIIDVYSKSDDEESFKNMAPVQRCYSQYICGNIFEMMNNLKGFIEDNGGKLSDLKTLSKFKSPNKLIDVLSRFQSLMMKNKCVPETGKQKKCNYNFNQKLYEHI